MTNAWSLLYDMMENEDILSFDTATSSDHSVHSGIDTISSIAHSQYYYDYDRNDSGRDSPFIDDGMPPWGHSDYEFTVNNDMDSIDLNLEATEKNGFWKYEEDLTMKEVRDYLSSTYQSHYTSKDSKTQTLDLIESIGDAEPFCRSNAIKYLSRFGKKNGKSKQDILKAIHYCILLYHFSGIHRNTSTRYETF